MSELIEWGNLVQPRVFAPPLRESLDGVHTKGGDFDAKEMADILDRPTITGDAVEHYRQMADGRPAIVFCCNRRHANHVAEQFQAAGYRFEVIDGTIEDTERDRLIESLANGRVQGLVSVDVISEGTDIPVAEVAIMLRATQSLSLFLQQAGRVLRPAEGKEYGLILDHVGNALRHGLPHADQDWTLEGRKRKKRGPRDDVDDNINILQCPSCYQVHEPRPSCPHCGHVYEVRNSAPTQREGTLQEIVETEEDRQKRLKRAEYGRARSVEALVAAGMSEGQARHRIEARREKERLQTELRDLATEYQQLTGRTVLDAWGFGLSEIQKMTAKPLRQHIEAISEAMFSVRGLPANDNVPQPGEQARLLA